MMSVFDSDTGEVFVPSDDDGEHVIVTPSTPFVMSTDGRGNMFVLNPDSGSVWRIDKRGISARIMSPIRHNFNNGGLQIFDLNPSVLENNPAEPEEYPHPQDADIVMMN